MSQEWWSQGLLSQGTPLPQGSAVLTLGEQETEKRERACSLRRPRTPREREYSHCLLSRADLRSPPRAQLPSNTHQTQGAGEEAWEGSPEDREEETEAVGAPGERQAGGWVESLQALVGTGVTLMAAVTP